MTTDTHRKEIAVEFKIGRSTVRIGGICKGAGMIQPGMATMLAFITTDLAIESAALKRALKIAVDQSFNRITVDGDMSTNDSVLALANGLAGNRPLKLDRLNRSSFQNALNFVCRELAKMIVRDGEGTSRVVALHVRGARNQEEAEVAARAVANSSLVRASWCGGDPNWGRLVAATGRSGARFVPEHATVEVGDVLLFRNGQPYDENASEAAALLQDSDIDIHVDLGTGGSGEATVWTCDLSAEYVRINGEYRT